MGKHTLVNVDEHHERQTCTVDEAARILGIGRNSAYQAVKRGELPAIRLGRRLVISISALEGLLKGRLRPDGSSERPETPRLMTKRGSGD